MSQLTLLSSFLRYTHLRMFASYCLLLIGLLKTLNFGNMNNTFQSYGHVDFDKQLMMVATCEVRTLTECSAAASDVINTLL